MPEIDYLKDRVAKRILKEKLFLLDYLQTGHGVYLPYPNKHWRLGFVFGI